MGGFGSGRLRGQKPAVEETPRIDLPWMMRTRRVAPGREASGSLHWRRTRDGSESGSITYSSVLAMAGRADQLVLTGKLNGQAFRQVIPLVSIPGGFGGRRWFMVCTVSGRRCQKMVLSPRHRAWVSIAASGLNYCSETADALDRLRLKSDRAHRALKDLPKRARRKRRERAMDAYVDAEAAWETLFDRMCRGWSARLEAVGATDNDFGL
jgi:hypothetical protein